ncbi:MAG: DUF748 domain-containing protein [Burkholderiales bacterium]|nr:DUF748 domain-containing protein [Burkholderiales bacterium]
MKLPLRLARRPASNPPTAPYPIPGSKRRRWGRIVIGVGIALAALVAFGFFAAPPIVKSVLTRQLTEQLERPVSIGTIRINPLLLTIQIDDFVVRERSGDARFVAFETLRVDLQFESIWRRAPVLREVYLAKPYVNVVRVDTQHYNFSDLIEKFTREPPDPNAEPVHFSLNNIRIEGGSIDFDDRPERTRHTVRNLTVGVPFVSNLPYLGDVFVQPAFGATINGTPFKLTGKTKPFSDARDTNLTAAFTGIDVPHYLNYVPVELPFRLSSAKLDAALDLTFSQPVGQAPKLSITGTTALREFEIRERDDRPMLKFPRLAVTLQQIDVFARRFDIQDIVLDQPALAVRRAADGSINLAALAAVGDNEPSPTTPAAPEKKSGPDMQLRIAEFRIDGAAVEFTDAVPSGSFSAKLSPLNIAVRDFDLAPGAASKAHLDVRSDGGESLTVDVEFGLAERRFAGTAKLDGVSPQRFVAYYRDQVLFDIVDGQLNLATDFTFANASEAPQLTLASASASLANVRLRKRGDKDDFLTLAELAVSDTSLDLASRSVVIGDITSRKARIAVRRARNGDINLSQLLPPDRIGPASSEASTADNTAGKPWSITLRKLLLDGYAVRFDDAVPADPVGVTLSPIRIAIDNLTLAPNAKTPATADVAIRLDTGGELKATGTVQPEPLDVAARVGVKNIAIEPFQPYFADLVNITLTSGMVAGDGQLKIRKRADGGLSVGYDGTAAINKLATVDKANAEDFLKWESLFLNGVKYRDQPFTLEIREIALTDFFSRITIDEKGTLNLQGIVASDSPSPEASAAAPPPADASRKPAGGAKPPPGSGQDITKQIRIDQVTLQNGMIAFSDRFIRPTVSATLTEVGGRVTGLLSDAATRADVDLRGKLANQAPLSITGQVNPLSGDLFANLKVSFRDIDLPPFTPYSGRYAGYTIAKGKLSLDLDYHIEKRQLTAGNRIFIDQFNFGDKVQSADATGLPVQLAVSLLKDRNGRINLDIPVEGSLDDPKFRIGSVIWQVIVNLITKAVTAPFALIGSLFGGNGEELSYLDFAPGSAALDATAGQKLDALAKALRERPALTLEVRGHVEPEKDRAALLAAAFERKLKAQKLKDLAKKGDAPASVDAVTIEPGADYETWLEKAYKAEKFPKPRNVIGLEKGLPAPEMEKLMQTNIAIGDDQLRDLALDRARTVKDFLAKAGDIAPERVFLIESATGAATGKEQQASSRVDFTLR